MPDTALRSQRLSSFILTTTLGTINYAHFVNKKNRVSSSNKVTHRKVQINRSTASRRNTSIIVMVVERFTMTASERAYEAWWSDASYSKLLGNGCQVLLGRGTTKTTTICKMPTEKQVKFMPLIKCESLGSSRAHLGSVDFMKEAP